MGKIDAGVPELNPLAEVRQARMAGIIWDEGFARVTDLADRFGVSAVTVWADLTALEARARVKRVRGGRCHRRAAGSAPSNRRSGRRPRKSSIGMHAARMIAAGDTVILDVGTTTTAIARALVLRTDLHDVTVVTNGLNIALELERATPRISVVVTGGTLRPLQHSLVNPLGTTLLERLHASVAFVGCNGVDPEVGITNVNLPEAEVKRAMLLAARRRDRRRRLQGRRGRAGQGVRHRGGEPSDHRRHRRPRGGGRDRRRRLPGGVAG